MRPCRPVVEPCDLSPVGSRTADRAAVGVAVVTLSGLDRLNLVVEPAERSLVPDVQLRRMRLGMDLMVIPGVLGLIVINVVIIHFCTFLLTFVKPAC